MLDHGMDPQEALDAPRCFATEGRLKIARGYTDAVRTELARMGHRIEVPDNPLGGGQAIVIDAARGILTGASDPRKDGCALGY
jgi:gamma-glutamyltranspeptidase/glutathione hydrolase